jgi:hypothetical protein
MANLIGTLLGVAGSIAVIQADRQVLARSLALGKAD